MRKAYPIILMMAAITTAGCTTTNQSTTQIATNLINRQSVTPTSAEKYPIKNPQKVAFYLPDEPPQAAYRVIGVAKVYKKNILGMRRKQDDMHEMMKKLAASIGGDALINVEQNNDSVRANVIAFQKIIF